MGGENYKEEYESGHPMSVSFSTRRRDYLLVRF